MSSDQQIVTVAYATGVISGRECSSNLSSCNPASGIRQEMEVEVIKFEVSAEQSPKRKSTCLKGSRCDDVRQN